MSRILSILKKQSPELAQILPKRAPASSYAHMTVIKEFAVPLPYKDEVRAICSEHNVSHSYASDHDDGTTVTFIDLKLESYAWDRIVATVNELNKLNSWDRQAQDSQNVMFQKLRQVYNEFNESLTVKFGKATIKSVVLRTGELDVQHDPNMNRVTFSSITINQNHTSVLSSLIRQYPDVEVKYILESDFGYRNQYTRVEKIVLTGEDADELLEASKQVMLYIQVRHMKEIQEQIDEKQRQRQLLREKDEAYLRDFHKEVAEVLSVTDEYLKGSGDIFSHPGD